jgi:hypothetical protein
MKVYNTQPDPLITLGTRVQSLESNDTIITEKNSELTLMCSTNSNIISQLVDIINTLSSAGINYNLGDILTWNTSFDTPSNAIVLTDSPQSLVTADYPDLYQLFIDNNYEFGDVFQVPFMTSPTAPSPYEVSALNNSSTAWRACDSSVSVIQGTHYWNSGGVPSWIEMRFGSSYKIVQYKFRPMSYNIYPAAWTVSGINNDDSYTILQEYSNQPTFDSGTRTYTLPDSDVLYKGIRLTFTAPSTAETGGFSLLGFYPIVSASQNPNTFNIPAYPYPPQTGKNVIMIVSNA